jgi:peptidoglycan-associated lipoprotein
MNSIRLSGLAMLVLILAGCGGDKATAPDDDLFGAYGGDQGQAGTMGSGQDGLGAGSEFGDGSGAAGGVGGPGGTLENRVVYFDFDQADVGEQYRELLQGHGRYLADNPGVRVRLEGHADERGSREYNIGLGERRAQAVKQFLLLQGVGAGQLSTVSYGEERPAVLGSDDEAWGLNRRVELVYVQ